MRTTIKSATGEQLKLHSSITEERLTELAKQAMFGSDNPGICAACGEEQDGCEPDARNYHCENCGQSEVYGVEELALMVLA